MKRSLLVVVVSFLLVFSTVGPVSAVDSQLDDQTSDVRSSEALASITVDKQNAGAYDSIQAAVDAASVGETVEVRPGTYQQQVEIDKRINLVAPDGATLDGSTLGSDSDGDAIEIISDTASPTIEGFTITGYADDGVEATGSSGSWTVRDVTVRDVGGSGLDANDATGDWTAVNLTVVNTGDQALDVDRTAGAWEVTDSRLRGNEDGIEGDNTTGAWVVRDTVVENSEFEGIGVRDSDGDWSITNVTVRNNADGGVETYGSTGNWEITSSTIVENSGVEIVEGDGWRVTGGGVGASSTSGDWRIRDSTIKRNQIGVAATNSEGDWVIASTEIDDNVYFGVVANDAAGNWQVRDSSVKEHSSAGIWAPDSEGAWVVSDTTLEANGGLVTFTDYQTGEQTSVRAGAITAFDSSGAWRIENVEINDSADGGVVAYDSTGDWTIEDSAITGTTGEMGITGEQLVEYTGMGVIANSNTGNWTVKNTTINRNQAGLLATYSEGDWVISDTEVRSNGDIGIAARRSTGAWLIQNTSVVNHTNSGVYARNTSNSWTIAYSRFERNGGRVTYTDSDAGRQRTVLSHAVDAFESSGAWTIRDSQFVDNAGGDVNAVNATNATVEGDARQNWWGQTSGPTEGQCVGNVTCEEWLSGPDGEPTGSTTPEIDDTSLSIDPFPVQVGTAPLVSVNVEDATDVYVDVSADGQEARLPMQNVEPGLWEVGLYKLQNPDIDSLERGTKVELSIVACNEVCTTETKDVLNRTDQAYNHSEMPTNSSGSRYDHQVERKRPIHYFVFEEVVDVPVILVDFENEKPSDHGFGDYQTVKSWEQSREYDINSFLGSDRGAMGSLGLNLTYYDNDGEFYRINSRSDYDRQSIVERIGSIGNPDFGKRYALTADGKNAAEADGVDIENEYIVTHPGEPLVKRAGAMNGSSNWAEKNLLPGDSERAYVAMNNPHHYGVWIHELSHLKFGLIDLYPDSDDVKGGVYNGVMSVNSEYGTPNNATNDDASLPSPYGVISRTRYSAGATTSNDDPNRPWVGITETDMSRSEDRTATVTVERINRTNIGDSVEVINTGEQGPDGQIKYAFELDPTSTKTEGYRLAERNGNLKRINEISTGIVDGARDHVSDGVYAEFDVTYTGTSAETRADVSAELVPSGSNREVVYIEGVSFPDISGVLDTQPAYTAPDADLRAVDSKGRVTGVTEDGEFVNEIPGAKASGDRVQGPEWISVPADADVEFEVSTADAQKFVDETNVSEENATISYTTEITEVGENPKLVTENGTVTVTNTTTTTTNQSAEPGETKEVSTGFSVAQFDRDDDNQIGFDDLRFALREFNNGNITFDQLRRVLQAYNTGESV